MCALYFSARRKRIKERKGSKIRWISELFYGIVIWEDYYGKNIVI